MPDRYATLVADLLAHADIRIDGQRSWDITVRDPRFYKRAIAGGASGSGESFMDGWWDCAALDEAIARMLGADLRGKIKLTPSMLDRCVAEHLPNLPYVVAGLRPFLSRFRSIMAAAEPHYEVGNDFYRKLLDPRMIYSCAYWDARDRRSTRRRTPSSTCRAASSSSRRACACSTSAAAGAGLRNTPPNNIDVSVVGVTISEQQRALAIERCRGLPVEIRLQDYRADRPGGSTASTSFGMFEHVGRQNFDAYMGVAHDCLTEDGLFLLETIGDNVSKSECNPWFQKYIFVAPTSMFPSITEIAAAIEGPLRRRGLAQFRRRLRADLASLARQPRGATATGSSRNMANDFIGCGCSIC